MADADYERLKTILFNPLIGVQTKQRILNSEFGITASRAEIRDMIRKLDAEMPINREASVRSRKHVPETKELRERGIGEGVHRGNEEARRVLHEAGIDIPAGKAIHHINGDHDDNRPENLALIDTENHEALHQAYSRDQLFNDYENMPEEDKKYYKQFGAVDFNEMPRYKVPKEAGKDADALQEIQGKYHPDIQAKRFEQSIKPSKDAMSMPYTPGHIDNEDLAKAFVKFKKSKKL